MRGFGAAWIVYRKELTDALRDRRTLLVVVLSSVAVGPLLLLALSVLFADIEERAELREVVVAGIEHAPTLRNFLLRQTYSVQAAPADFEAQLKDSKLGNAVLVVDADFESALARGTAPPVSVVTSSANTRAQASAARVARLLQGFSSEQAGLRLATRGVAPALMQVLDVQQVDLANPQTRAAQLTGMLPFFVLMAVLYGALNAALDTTAGERERGSLEPLLMNPAPRLALVAGKWAAVASVGMLIAVLSCLSFLPGQWLLQSETLAAMFQFELPEAGLFVTLLIPLAAAVSALMMAIAIRCKTFKEAQANNTVIILVVSILPLITLFNPTGERRWHLWVPALGQVTLMNRVLKGETLTPLDVAAPLLVSIAITALCVAYVARALRRVAVR
jgi:sodium transport system permease protein